MKKWFVWLLLVCLLVGCGRQEDPQTEQTPPSEKGEQLRLPEDAGAAALPSDASPVETVPVDSYADGSEDERREVPWDTVLQHAEPYTPTGSMEPDTVPANTMGEVLCDQVLPHGLRIVCYWEPGSVYTKYWAIRQDDQILRFCREESGYDGGYTVESFTDVLGQDGFRILCPRGAAYYACDYYVLNEHGVPQLLAACSGEVEETDFNDDGETDLRWYYHGGWEIYTCFHQDGQMYLSSLDGGDL